MSLVALSRVIASSTAGFAEIYCFHPFDTITKRLQSNRDKDAPLSKVIFGSAANKGLKDKYLSLVPGMGFAVAYKVVQRVYKFTAQPLVCSVVKKAIVASPLSATMSANFRRVLTSSIAGSLVGAGEVALLPLDYLKVQFQATDKKRTGTLQMIREEGVKGLYKGAGWTLARNVPGSLALFGASSLAKEIMGKQFSTSLAGHTISSFVGSMASIVVSSPMDTLKTRAQLPGGSDLWGLLKNEGFSGLFKGMGMKLLVTAPKLIFAMTVSEWLSHHIVALMGGKNGKNGKNGKDKKAPNGANAVDLDNSQKK